MHTYRVMFRNYVGGSVRLEQATVHRTHVISNGVSVRLAVSGAPTLNTPGMYTV